MKETVFEAIVAFFLGHKYYVNIINTRGTGICETTNRIHHSKEEAEEHKRQIDSTESFLFIETVSFRSRKLY